MPGGMGFPGLVQARGGCGAARRVLRAIVGGPGDAAWVRRVLVGAECGAWAGLALRVVCGRLSGGRGARLGRGGFGPGRL